MMSLGTTKHCRSDQSAPWRRLTVVVVALAAFLFQGVSLSGHYHPVGAGLDAALSAPTAAALDDDHRNDDSAALLCGACWAAANAIAHTPPQAHALSAPQHWVRATAAYRFVETSVRYLGRNWRSRAPPLS